ncbi:C4-dicarboxylate transporter DcuC [Streptobacillus moniliformis]|uniref:Anaerobic c4-dicarboxylate antiporter, DcuC family n=1 Tax=Streptobacillus moniliformis (strain ATCC 14647 / DSM 12112 / NCTC 10651 / 9901) TaxID=519441 RepID=D1AXX0_STRM9|nr:C4-dicarboxylate transporter DcuC [Streptobacillus moniliformis]ACZ01146.1 anaerobic c4-dicarboxylate antiporter, DcuC family [Streptobacillus moniliformis DSM 12112]AVL42493.1 C4-dicarboxylate ABC transporter [Streptobacillus moniliformis]SQA13702.1 Putative cryptic C4-dicarboxylate transporter DcuD [Streptobacillus moniliformis]
MFVIIIGFLSVLFVGYMLLKKHDIKITLFGVGLLLLYISQILKGEYANFLLNPIDMLIKQFGTTLSGAGLVIFVLGGYSAYMSAIGANDMTVMLLTKPLKKVKSVYILVPIVFLLGNLLSLVIPSASNLAIILIATLFPVLRKSGMSNLTAAAIIATTATIMPTPLGADNVAVAAELGVSVEEYVFGSHSLISIPTLFFMAIVHMIWQRYCDKRQVLEKEFEQTEDQIKYDKPFSLVYSLLPLLPIIILLTSFVLENITETKLSLSVLSVSIISVIFTLLIEIIKNRNVKTSLISVEQFFKGMGNSMGIVVLLVAASTYVNGLKGIGLINILQEIMTKTSASGILLPVILVIFSAIIVLLSGSGTALFFALVPLLVPLAMAANISPIAISVPLGLSGNLLRAVSPVSAVVMIVSGAVKEDPISLVKRTSVPMIAGVIFMLILSLILF